MFKDEPTGNATLDAMMARNAALWCSPEYKMVLDKRKRVLNLNNRWDTRRYSGRGLHRLQRWADEYIIAQLRRALPEFNQSLREYRERHGVTPRPIYHLPEIGGEGSPIDGCRVKYETTKGTVGTIPLEDIARLSPGQRGGLVIVNQRFILDGDDNERGELCGFCGKVPPYKLGGDVERKHFTYPEPTFIGFSPGILVCGEKACTEMALPNHVRNMQMQESMNNFMLAVSAAMMGRERLTETQAGYLHDQAVQRMMERMQQGGK